MWPDGPYFALAAVLLSAAAGMFSRTQSSLDGFLSSLPVSKAMRRPYGSGAIILMLSADNPVLCGWPWPWAAVQTASMSNAE